MLIEDQTITFTATLKAAKIPAEATYDELGTLAVNLTALEREVIRMRCRVQTLQIAASGIWHPLPGF